jgi:NAD-reducing hydrogenase large subunit
MSNPIVIEPVTRIEGHAKISIHLDDHGEVRDAHFHVTQFRGFEKFCEGRPFWEMPAITARICGICPVSHLLASAKAGDQILAVKIPVAAMKLRRLINLAQIVQSHALSFFHLSAPDLLLGMDSDPQQRNLFGLIAAEPEFARGGIRLRQWGQEIINRVGGRKIHPSWAVPGGVRQALAAGDRSTLLEAIPSVQAIGVAALDRFRQILDQFQQEAAVLGNFPSLFMGLVGSEGEWEHYDGHLRILDSEGSILADREDATAYADLIAEAVDPQSYLKSPYYRPLGLPDPTTPEQIKGLYRVGPLARLNLCSSMGSPLADQAWREYRQRGGAGGLVFSSFYYHYARLVEILAAIERIETLLQDPDLSSPHLRAQADVNQLQGIGVSEAPRGTLFHDYQVDATGLIRQVNLIIATGHNNLAMNRTIQQVARHYIHGPEIPEGMLNRVEAGIRAFDPCLSCSTHAVGQMPLHLQLWGSDGMLLHEIWRDERRSR